MTAATQRETYTATMRGGYSRHHLVIKGSGECASLDRAACGKVPAWDGWAYSGDVVKESVHRFGADVALCRRCFPKGI